MAAIVQQQQQIPDEIQTIFAMIDLDNSGGISAAEFYNLATSLLLHAGVPNGPNNDFNALAFTQNELANHFNNNFQNGMMDLPNFHNFFMRWYNHQQQSPNTTPAINNSVNNVLSQMVNGTASLNPSAYTPISGSGMPVAHEVIDPLQQNNNIPIAVIEPVVAPVVDLVVAPVVASAEEPDVCGICLGEDDGTPIRQLACGHKFHVNCINQWDQTRLSHGQPKNCPTCRAEYAGGKRKRKRRPRTKKKKSKPKRLKRRKSSRRFIRRKKGKTKRKRKRKH